MDNPISAARCLPSHFHAAKQILSLAFPLQRYHDRLHQRVSCMPTVQSFGPYGKADVHQLWPWLPDTKVNSNQTSSIYFPINSGLVIRQLVNTAAGWLLIGRCVCVFSWPLLNMFLSCQGMFCFSTGMLGSFRMTGSSSNYVLSWLLPGVQPPRKFQRK